MEIKGYTLHGDYYLTDNVIPNKSWKQALKMEEEITLPNGKTIIAHILSKEELKDIPQEERGMEDWYWTSTSDGDECSWIVNGKGGFNSFHIFLGGESGGARLGFKNPFIES